MCSTLVTMRSAVLIALLTNCFVVPPVQLHKQYRKDYEYNEKTDAFYKLHTEGNIYNTAKLLCKAEGGYVMAPGPLDVEQAHHMMKQFPDMEDNVFVGDDGREYPSAEQIPMIEFENSDKESNVQCDVLTRSGEIATASCYKYLPFICKVYAKHLVYNEKCRTYSDGYEYKELTGSCYKIPTSGMTWYSGLAYCAAEGGHLVVINSVVEDHVLWNMTLAAPTIPRVYYGGNIFFVGFRTVDEYSREFRTVFNQTLQEAGFDMWSDNEPNNRNGIENCGSLFKADGRFNDATCGATLAVICEKEISVK